MISSTVEKVIRAPRELVYETFADRERNSEFLPIQVSLVRPGTDARQGVGAVHQLGFGRFGLREELTELVPGERIGYKLVSGLPVKAHTGEILFSDAPGGTRVSYTMHTDPKLPAPAAVIQLILKQTISQFLAGASKAAEQRAAAA